MAALKTTLKDGARLIILGIEHVAYRGRLMPTMAGGERTLEELEARNTEIRERIQEIDNEHRSEALPDDARTEWNQLNEELDRNDAVITELRARRQRVESLEGNEPSRENGAEFHTPRPGTVRGDDIWDLSEVRQSVTSPGGAARELRERADRMIDRAQFPHERADRERSQAHLQRLLDVVDSGDRSELARHLLVTGSPAYRRAFGKALAGKPLTGDEQRALSVGVDGSGGFAVPAQLDPTIIPTSSSSVNPYRAISRVESIAGTDTWRGVSSAGVTATRSAEAAEVGDNAPALAQPEVVVKRVQSFIPFSIEIGQDWGGMEAEMAKLLQDAKDDEEAASFTTGDGVDPHAEGIITGATTTLDTITAATCAAADVYALEENLPPRFRSRAVWVANRSIYNKVRQFDTTGGAQLWLRLAQGLANQVPAPGNTGADLIGYPANESSSMTGPVVAGNLIAVLGDFRYFLIVDRIGMSVEIVQHLFGANRRPTGQRGLYAFWRNNSKVLSPNAFRVLKVKA
jgi:HK97 family phage major capsid protein